MHKPDGKGSSAGEKADVFQVSVLSEVWTKQFGSTLKDFMFCIKSLLKKWNFY